MKAKAAVAWEAKKTLSIEMVDGYDHSYHFISTFIENILPIMPRH